MLEFLGFVALIAIIFGVSFATALGGIIQIIVIGVCILVAIGLIIWLLTSKSGSLFVLLSSVVVIIMGIGMINDKYDERKKICQSTTSGSLYSNCLLKALEGHNDAINKGWGFAICGGIVCFVSLGAWGSQIDTTKKNPTKKR